MAVASAFALGPLIVPELNATNAALLLLAGTNIFSYASEATGTKNMGYSRFAKPSPTNIPSRLGMFLFYLPALIASGIGLASSLPPGTPLASLLLDPGALLGAALDSRPLLVAGMLTLHFLKRSLEVLFMQKFSGTVELSTLAAVPVYYAICAAACIYFAQVDSASGLIASGSVTLPAVAAVGCIMFVVGELGNLYHHWLLAQLRSASSNSTAVAGDTDKGGSKYKVPQGGLFGLVTCPHYFFELMAMYGIALTCQSLFAYVMAAGMTSYLAGRSQAHRAWYLRTLPGYPPERKALVPFLF